METAVFINSAEKALFFGLKRGESKKVNKSMENADFINSTEKALVYTLNFVIDFRLT